MSLSDVLIPLSIFLIMLGIGLNLRPDNFRQVFVQPKAILLGLFLQLIFLPVLGFLVAFIWQFSPAISVGIVLISACPGGTASNLVTHVLKGRVALSVALTSFNSFLILFTIPAIVTFAASFFLNAEQEVSLSFWRVFQSIFGTVILPVGLGMMYRQFKPGHVKQLKPYLKYLLPGILIGVFILVAIDSTTGSENQLDTVRFGVLVPLIFLNVAAMLLSFAIAKAAGIKKEGRYTLAIEIGLQNSALAIFIATQILENEEMAMVALLYSSFSFFTTLAIAYLLKRKMMPILQG